MPITSQHVGRSYPPAAPYTVSEAKIAEFAQALGGAEGGDPNPAYQGPDAVAPPTFAVLIAARAWGSLFDDPELGLALQRTVHADQSFVYERPLRVGDRVTAALTIEKVSTRGPVDFVGVRVDLDTLGGERVCIARSTLLHTREAVA